MRKLILLALIALASSCHKNAGPQDHYYGSMTDGSNRYRFTLDCSGVKPVLTIISFRGYEIPLEDYVMKGDSIFFNRADENAQYKGQFDYDRKTIHGEWITDDTLKLSLTFIAANPDTIKGLNPRTANSYSYVAPPKEDDGLEVCEVSDVMIDRTRIDSLVYSIIKKKFGYVHSLLIARNNCLAVEEYFFEYRREAHFGIQSVTKSFVSALTGIAIEKGEIKNTQATVCSLLPYSKDLFCNSQNRSINLHDVMNMSTGLAWDEVSYDYGHPKNSAVIASETSDPLRYLFSQPRSSKKMFAYNSYNHTLMSHVLHESTRLSNIDEYNQRLIHPLGITQYDLGEPDNGIIGDIFLRPRDMMKFGLMYLNNGAFNGKQIVPSDWVKESTTPKIFLGDDLGYGYFWWTKKFKYKKRKVDTYFAWGYGGQYIFVIPSLETVVVLNGTNWSTDPKKYYFEMMEDFILPALEDRSTDG